MTRIDRDEFRKAMQVSRLINQFPYKRVSKCMAALGWTWLDFAFSPTTEDMKNCIADLFISLLEDDGNDSVNTGGFRASRWKDEEGKEKYEIEFVVACLSSDEVEP